VISELLECINELTKKINQIENDIQNATGIVIKEYRITTEKMDENQSYFLSGIQYGIPGKSYLLTPKGIEVLGEETIEISEFINLVINYANNPTRKIEVLKELVTHLQKFLESINNTSV
jgi:effector-binding domain-containing protein